MIKFSDLFDDTDNKTNIKDIFTLKNKQQIPWVDKYRPSKLDEIVYQDEVVKMLKQTIIDGNLPHLLFYGPPGTGKTSTILAIALELFGPKKFKERVIELNASDERGINVVRGKIVTFAKTAIGDADPKYKCPPYKIIILDEADAMTTEAQSALRKIMEDKSNITRFCFICNYINQIIEPINSRCVKFRFKPLTGESITKKLLDITKKENMIITKPVINEIIKLCKGDMRKSIMLLQHINYIKHNQKITIDFICELTGYINDELLNEINNKCIITRKNNIKIIMELANKIRSSGYPIYNILNQINTIIIKSNILDNQQKADICIIISDTEKRLLDGADEYLQLLNLLISINKC